MGRRNAGAACMAVGIALFLAALSLFCFNEGQSAAAGAKARTALEGLAAWQATAETADPADADAMPVATVDGLDYVGSVRFPVLGLELPVLAEWSDETLTAAPCRYSGTLASGDLVLAGHNYTRHFGRLDNLLPGDEVVFATMNGVEHRFTVALVETLPAAAVAEMTAGEYPLSLFTCDYSGQARITVRCTRAGDAP